jgi:hypothetical protein
MARPRGPGAPRPGGAALVCAAAWARPRVANVGWAGMPPGPPRAVMPPGQHHTPSRAGARALRPGPSPPGLGARPTHARGRDLRHVLAERSPAAGETRRAGAGAHSPRPQAAAVAAWLATPPRLTRLLWPPSWPHAPPRERRFGAGHACGPPNQRRPR